MNNLRVDVNSFDPSKGPSVPCGMNSVRYLGDSSAEAWDEFASQCSKETVLTCTVSRWNKFQNDYVVLEHYIKQKDLGGHK
jgi:hypothetical protein